MRESFRDVVKKKVHNRLLSQPRLTSLMLYRTAAPQQVALWLIALGAGLNATESSEPHQYWPLFFFHQLSFRHGSSGGGHQTALIYAPK